MKIVILAILVVSTALLSGSIVNAHVVVMDKNSDTTLLVHVTPADDPIAGEKSNIYLDIKTREANSYLPSNLLLAIADESQAINIVPFKIFGTTITAEYTFPAQGLYTISLKSQGGIPMQPIELEYSLRVSRGIGSEPPEKNTWGSSLITVGFIGFAILAILAVNNRRELSRFSRY